jgi:hypothetical protein
MALLALDMGHEADAAGVVLVGAGIQALFLQMGISAAVVMARSFSFRGKGAYCDAQKMPNTLIGVRVQIKC